MRFMVIIKSNPETENATGGPSEEILAAMGKYNEELVNAGVMVDGEGLHPSSKGARIQFTDGKPAVIDGPFTEAKELIAGYWMWRVDSLAEAIEWAKHCPHPGIGEGESELEIRQVFEMDDFGEEFTPELRAQEERLRSQLETKS